MLAVRGNMKSVVILMTPLFASPARCDSLVSGSGVDTCGTWVQRRSSDRVFAALDEEWVLGFLSGFAAANSSDFLKDTDPKGIFAAMDQECSKDPLDHVAEAADRVGARIIKRSGGR
jgi:hypothetical protein